MDNNKLSKLRSLDYTIKKCCGLCEHAQFNFLNIGNVWGDCNIHTYNHAKHSGVKQLSINMYGSCNDFKWNESIIDGYLLGWKEFLKK